MLKNLSPRTSSSRLRARRISHRRLKWQLQACSNTSQLSSRRVAVRRVLSTLVPCTWERGETILLSSLTTDLSQPHSSSNSSNFKFLQIHISSSSDFFTITLFNFNFLQLQFSSTLNFLHFKFFQFQISTQISTSIFNFRLDFKLQFQSLSSNLSLKF